MIIGIIAGVKEEINNLCTQKAVRRHIYGIDFTIDTWEGKQVVLAHAGTGKVAAAMAASLLIAKFQAQALIVTGTAGALDGNINRTYLITTAVQHDFGVDTDGGREIYLAGVLPVPDAHGPAGFHTPEAFALKFAELIGDTVGGTEIEPGIILTGDTFVQSAAMVEALKGTASIVDMETAAVAQVANQMRIPWIAAKSTTDHADQSADADWWANLEEAAARAGEVTRRIVHLT